jgi:hypothetical protein
MVGGLAQDVGPEFKSQYHKKNKTKKELDQKAVTQEGDRCFNFMNIIMGSTFKTNIKFKR